MEVWASLLLTISAIENIEEPGNNGRAQRPPFNAPALPWWIPIQLCALRSQNTGAHLPLPTPGTLFWFVFLYNKKAEARWCKQKQISPIVAEVMNIKRKQKFGRSQSILEGPIKNEFPANPADFPYITLKTFQVRYGNVPLLHIFC